MNLAKDLTHQIQNLPDQLKQEAIDFVEFLRNKPQLSPENQLWSDFSLSSAMSGIEEEPGYDESYLKEKW